MSNVRVNRWDARIRTSVNTHNLISFHLYLRLWLRRCVATINGDNFSSCAYRTRAGKKRFPYDRWTKFKGSFMNLRLLAHMWIHREYPCAYACPRLYDRKHVYACVVRVSTSASRKGFTYIVRIRFLQAIKPRCKRWRGEKWEERGRGNREEKMSLQPLRAKGHCENKTLIKTSDITFNTKFKTYFIVSKH